MEIGWAIEKYLWLQLSLCIKEMLIVYANV